MHQNANNQTDREPSNRMAYSCKAVCRRADNNLTLLKEEYSPQAVDKLDVRADPVSTKVGMSSLEQFLRLSLEFRSSEPEFLLKFPFSHSSSLSVYSRSYARMYYVSLMQEFNLSLIHI